MTNTAKSPTMYLEVIQVNYKRYKVSRDLAWQILLREHVCALPVSVSELARGMGIRIMYYKSDNEDDGYSTLDEGEPMIFINSAAANNRKRFTAAHELGHILLGHVGKYALVNREPSASDNPIEQEANVFASRILAPACVLWALDVHSAEQISKLCNISMTAAQYRMDRMNILYKRGKFLTSPLERMVYEQFQPFIRSCTFL